MYFKRFYKDVDREKALDHVKVLRMPTTDRKHFTQRFIDQSFADGWSTFSKGKLILHVVWQDKPIDLEFKVLATPGYFCCHDDHPCLDEKDSRDYIEKNFAGVKSPDSNNPAGYRKDNFYRCELVNRPQEETDNG